jgi:hypothetical protein
MDRTARERSARWRDRRRVDAIAINLDVLPKHRRALEAIGAGGAGRSGAYAAAGLAGASIFEGQTGMMKARTVSKGGRHLWPCARLRCSALAILGNSNLPRNLGISRTRTRAAVVRNG